MPGRPKQKASGDPCGSPVRKRRRKTAAAEDASTPPAKEGKPGSQRAKPAPALKSAASGGSKAIMLKFLARGGGASAPAAPAAPPPAPPPASRRDGRVRENQIVLFSDDESSDDTPMPAAPPAPPPTKAAWATPQEAQVVRVRPKQPALPMKGHQDGSVLPPDNDVPLEFILSEQLAPVPSSSSPKRRPRSVAAAVEASASGRKVPLLAKLQRGDEGGGERGAVNDPEPRTPPKSSQKKQLKSPRRPGSGSRQASTRSPRKVSKGAGSPSRCSPRRQRAHITPVADIPAGTRLSFEVDVVTRSDTLPLGGPPPQPSPPPSETVDVTRDVIAAWALPAAHGVCVLRLRVEAAYTDAADVGVVELQASDSLRRRGINMTQRGKRLVCSVYQRESDPSEAAAAPAGADTAAAARGAPGGNARWVLIDGARCVVWLCGGWAMPSDCYWRAGDDINVIAHEGMESMVIGRPAAVGVHGLHAGVVVCDRAPVVAVHSPGVLVSATEVSDAIQCVRKAWLSSRARTPQRGVVAKAALAGVVVHGVVQRLLRDKQHRAQDIRSAIADEVRRLSVEYYATGESDASIKEDVARFVPPVANCIASLVRSPYSATEDRFGSVKSRISNADLTDVETRVECGHHGLKGFVDVQATVDIEDIGGRGLAGARRRTPIALELKSIQHLPGKGKPLLKTSHKAQLLVYLLVLGMDGESPVTRGLIAYLAKGCGDVRFVAVNREELWTEVQHIVRVRNALAAHLVRETAPAPDYRNAISCKYCNSSASCLALASVHGVPPPSRNADFIEKVNPFLLTTDPAPPSDDSQKKKSKDDSRTAFPPRPATAPPPSSADANSHNHTRVGASSARGVPDVGCTGTGVVRRGASDPCLPGGLVVDTPRAVNVANGARAPHDPRGTLPREVSSAVPAAATDVAPGSHRKRFDGLFASARDDETPTPAPAPSAPTSTHPAASASNDSLHHVGAALRGPQVHGATTREDARHKGKGATPTRPRAAANAVEQIEDFQDDGADGGAVDGMHVWAGFTRSHASTEYLASWHRWLALEAAEAKTAAARDGRPTAPLTLLSRQRGNITTLHALQEHERLRELVADLAPPKFASSDGAAGSNGRMVNDAAEKFRLNGDQRRALERAVVTEDYLLIQGLPGTGKTTTIAALVYLLAVLQRKRVLVVAGTNSAVDTIALKLKETHPYPVRALFADEHADAHARKAKQAFAPAAAARPVPLKPVPFVPKQPHTKTAMGDDAAATTFYRVYPTSMGAAGKYDTGKRTEGPKVHPTLTGHVVPLDFADRLQSVADVARCMSRMHVVCTTAHNLHHPLLTCRGDGFDCVIVDEAAQTLQPVAVGALFLASRFILVGDHEQLPPIMQSETATREGATQSLLERLARAHPDAVVTLAQQYRMNAPIAALSNLLTYHGRLKTGSLDVARRRLMPRSDAVAGSGCEWLRQALAPDPAVLFIDTTALSEGAPALQARNTCDVEARMALSIAAHVASPGVTVGIISPFRPQVDLLASMLAAEGTPHTEVYTIDQAQGKDLDVVVISLAKRPGATVGDLIRSPRRLNVAFTRAKLKQVCVGAFRGVFDSIAEWAPILQHARETGAMLAPRQLGL